MWFNHVLGDLPWLHLSVLDLHLRCFFAQVSFFGYLPLMSSINLLGGIHLIYLVLRLQLSSIHLLDDLLGLHLSVPGLCMWIGLVSLSSLNLRRNLSNSDDWYNHLSYDRSVSFSPFLIVSLKKTQTRTFPCLAVSCTLQEDHHFSKSHVRTGTLIESVSCS